MRELELGELVELNLEAYPHTDWLVGVDMLWTKRGRLGKASAWMKDRLIAHKVYELDRHGNRTTL